MKLLTLTALLLLSTGALAEFRITMGGGVYHWIGDRDELNEANYFVGASAGPVFGATFVNSFGDRSLALGGVIRGGSTVEASVYGGIVTGYGDPDWLPCLQPDVCAFAAPGVSWWIKEDVALTGILFGDAAMYGVSLRW